MGCHAMECKEHGRTILTEKLVRDGPRAGMRGGSTVKGRELWGDGSVVYCDCDILTQPQTTAQTRGARGGGLVGDASDS